MRCNIWQQIVVPQADENPDEICRCYAENLRSIPATAPPTFPLALRSCALAEPFARGAFDPLILRVAE